MNLGSMTKEEIQKRLFSVENELDKLRDKVKLLEERNPVFKPPHQAEVNDYFALKGGSYEDAGKYYNYYQSKNWMVGKSKMKDWKAAARNWISKNPQKSSIFDL